MHVVDGSDAQPEEQITAVREVLVEIDEEQRHDAAGAAGGQQDRRRGDLALARLRHLLPDAVFVSARTGEGIDGCGPGSPSCCPTRTSTSSC